MKKKILILGTGNAQEDIIRYCKEDGFEVYACSYTKGDKAEKYADHFALINIIEVEQIEKYIQENNIDYIYSAGSDIAMPSVTKVAEDLNLPCFVSSRTAFVCNNKNVLREELGENFKGNLQYVVLSSVPEKIALDFPVIMKPVDSQGQRGVIKVNNIEELQENFERSMSFSHIKKVIVEEYVEGNEISVNAFVKNGEMQFALVSDREVWEDFPGGIIRKHILPGKYAGSQVEEKIIDLVKRVVDKLEIKNGPAYFQIKIKNEEEPKLLEVTPRLDGCHMWRVIKEYTGVDLLAASVKLLKGEEVDLNYQQTILSEASLEFMCAGPGTNFVKDSYDVSDSLFVKYYYEDNDVVKKMNGYMEKCGYIIRGCK